MKWLLGFLIVSSGSWMLFFSVGLSIGVSTVAIPQLRIEANSTASISDEMASWISSITGYMGVISVLGMTWSAHRFGRKKTSIFVTIVAFVAFLFLYCSTNANHLLISQALQGLTSASLVSTSLMILTEYISPRYRGVFLTIKSASTFWGIWVANAIGTFYNYRNVGLCGIICVVISFVTTCIMPESPYWLACKEKYEECSKSHRWLKGSNEGVEKELQDLIKKKKDSKQRKKANMSLCEHFLTHKRNLSKPEVYKPTVLSIIVMTLYHFSGKLVCTVYAIQIIKKITGSNKTAFIGMLILDGVTVMGMYIGCGFSKIFKRRTLLILATSVGICFLYSISLYLYLVKLSLILENPILTISLLLGFSLSLSCGPLILSTSLVGELMPLKSRNICCFITAVTINFMFGTSLKCSPYMFTYLGFHGAFLVFAITTTVSLILLYCYLPETKDKTLQEIENLFKTSKSSVEPTEEMLLARNHAVIN